VGWGFDPRVFLFKVTPASKVLCPLDFGALAVLPHGQIAGFRAFFWTFGNCIRPRKNTLFRNGEFKRKGIE
jgi:hypothetical protein